MRSRYKLEYHALMLSDRFFCSMPNPLRHLISGITGFIIYFIIPIRKGQVIKNLTIAFPEKSVFWKQLTALKTYIHFTKVFIDFFFIWKSRSVHFNQYVTSNSKNLIDDVLSRGKGAVIVMSHFGNWEALCRWFLSNNYRFGAISKRQKNPLANRMFNTIRESQGIKLFSMKESPSTILNFLGGNGILGAVADQDAKKRGIYIRFFNQFSSTFRGPAVFALRQKCPLIAGTCILIKGQYIAEFVEISKKDPSDKSLISDITQRYTDYFEKKIKAHPEQYLWFHRRWKTRPPESVEQPVL